MQKKIIVLIGVYVLAAACFYGSLAYVAMHFIQKVW